jgi:hypothetical protein
LPEEMQEQLGEDVLHFIDRYLSLVDDLNAGLRELDEGKGIPAHVVFSELRKSLGA